jgi:putative spermidine/putrescine transport system permease protein
VIALIEIMMPYAILVMLSGFGRVDQSLEEAARSLGASRSQAFWKVTFPLSAPGVLAAALLVFVLSISSFVTPKLMGGGRVFLLSTEIYNEATQTLNWPLAAAMSTMLVMIFGIFVVIQRRLLKMVNK